MAIELDNEVVSAPAVQADSAVFQPFERSSITISGRFTEQEARDVALVLDYGALPVELEAQQSQIVSASLGTDALSAGVLAGIIGLGLVSAYLMFYYRLLGLVAIASLGLSGAMLWTIIAFLGESQGLALTLAGVTGLIVAIGVSVDSNIVYFEHLKEDVRSGRTLRSAVDRAFPVAFSTIVKANFASLIAAGVLYWLTAGAVRGFALYLGLATILDLVATYFFMGPADRPDGPAARACTPIPAASASPPRRLRQTARRRRPVRGRRVAAGQAPGEQERRSERLVGRKRLAAGAARRPDGQGRPGERLVGRDDPTGRGGAVSGRALRWAVAAYRGEQQIRLPEAVAAGPDRLAGRRADQRGQLRAAGRGPRHRVRGRHFLGGARARRVGGRGPATPCGAPARPTPRSRPSAATPSGCGPTSRAPTPSTACALPWPIWPASPATT